MIFLYALKVLNVILSIFTKRAIVGGTSKEVSMTVGESEFDVSQDEERHICHIVRDWAEFRINEILNDPNQSNLDAQAIENEFIEWLEYDGTSDLEYLCIEPEHFKSMLDNR
jgi:hypothetical protein